MIFFRKSVKQNKNAEEVKQATNQEPFSIEKLKKEFNHTDDFQSRRITVQNQTYEIYYISTLIDQNKLELNVILPLTDLKQNDIINELYTKEIKTVTNNNEAMDDLLTGSCLLVNKEDHRQGYLLSIASSVGREVSEPLVEKTMQGAHEGFVENIDENITLLRNRVVTPSFIVKKYTVGKEIPTELRLLYIDGLAQSNILRKVEERLDKIQLDYIRSPGEIQDFLEDNSFSPFPQLLYTEQTEGAALSLMDGKIIILVNGSPKVFILPATFTLFFQTPDDFASRWELGNFFKFLRLLSYLNALILPALYIAVVTYHYEVIPTELVYSFQASLSYVPFLPIIELLMMQFTFELLREASIRLPPSIAATFGIVGAIVVGTAMVEAGFVSFGGLIVVALTAVSSFVQSNFEMSNSIRVLGFPLMLFAGIFGFLGIMLGLLIIFIHLSRLTSFGVPYFTPFAPLELRKFSEMVIRTPAWMKVNLKKEPAQLSQSKKKRAWKIDENEDPY